MTEGRADLIAQHDELVEQYNEHGGQKLLEQIAFLEMLLIASEPAERSVSA